MGRVPARALATVAFWLLIGMGSWVYAQEAPPAEESSPPGQPERASVEPDEDEARATASADVFIPTEEISEDSAVPFPVDI